MIDAAETLEITEMSNNKGMLNKLWNFHWTSY